MENEKRAKTNGPADTEAAEARKGVQRKEAPSEGEPAEEESGDFARVLALWGPLMLIGIIVLVWKSVSR